MIRLRWASTVAVAALVLTACGTTDDVTPETDETGGNGGGHIVYAEQFLPEAGWATESNDAFTLSRAGCLESLVRYETDGSVTPGLATSWEQTEPTAWDFTLREDVTFQNGTAFNADAVVGALNHVLEVTAPARSFNPDVISEVSAVDETTVRITTPAPDVLVPLRMASPNTGILAPEAYSGDRIDIIGTCTGPFTVVEEVPRQSLNLERNDDYWGDAAKVSSAEVRFVADGAARATQIQTGESHIAAFLPAASRSRLEGDENVELLTREMPRTTVLLLNNSRPPFDDPTVREAVQHALDREAIAATVYEGGATAAIGPFSPDDAWAPEGKQLVAHDPEEAERLLNEAGVDSLNIELIAYSDRAEFGDLAAVIQDQLGRVGVNVDIRAGEYVVVEPDLLEGNFDAALLSRGYLVDVADPGGYLRSDWTCEGGYNLAHYCDEQTDQMISEAASNEDLEARNQMYAEIAEWLQSEAVSAFLVHESAMFGTRANVSGYEIHPLQYYVLAPDVAVGGN